MRKITSIAPQAIYDAALACVFAVREPSYSLPLHVAAVTWKAAILGFAVYHGPALAGWPKRLAQQPVMA